MSRTIGITGASGYVGRALVSGAVRAGDRVVSIGRRPVPDAEQHRDADLHAAPPPTLLDGLDAVVHLAAQTADGDLPAQTEVAFARSLAQSAQARGIPMIFVSSQAAATDAPSAYGRTKAAIEAAIAPFDATVLRLGLVIGGDEAGLFGLLTALVRSSPVVPDLWPSPIVQPVHVDDVALAVLAAIDPSIARGRVLAIAGPAVGFGDFLRGIARYRLRRRRLFVPVPVALLRWLLALGARVAGPRLSPARLDSLVRLRPLAAAADVAALGLQLRSLPDALGRRGTPTRRLLREASAFGTLVLGHAPTPRVLRRYVRVLAALGINTALPLDERVLATPAALGRLDSARARQASVTGDVAWRIGAVVRLIEAEPLYAGLFLPLPGHDGRSRALFHLARASGLEAWRRVRGLLARPGRDRIEARER